MHFVSEAWVSLQLTNSAEPIVTFRLFAFGIGVSRIKSAEAHLASTEMVLFELLRTAADPKFKEIIKIVK
jgi:hypothetical protein